VGADTRGAASVRSRLSAPHIRWRHRRRPLRPCDVGERGDRPHRIRHEGCHRVPEHPPRRRGWGWRKVTRRGPVQPVTRLRTVRNRIDHHLVQTEEPYLVCILFELLSALRPPLRVVHQPQGRRSSVVVLVISALSLARSPNESILAQRLIWVLHHRDSESMLSGSRFDGFCHLQGHKQARISPEEHMRDYHIQRAALEFVDAEVERRIVPREHRTRAGRVGDH